MVIPEGDEGRKFDSFYAGLPPERYVLTGAAIQGRWWWGGGKEGEGGRSERDGIKTILNDILTPPE